MNTLLRTTPVLLVLALTAASCGTMRSVSEVRDDVYYMPGDEPVASTTPIATPERSATPEPEPEPKAAPQDDYYDANSAAQYAGPGSYYDMAYNDPYYYNYGRFGFNSGVGMGWQTGWNGPGWGMSMGYGWGSGMNGWSMGLGYGWGGYGGFYDPFWNGGFGYGFGYPSWAWRNPGWGWYNPAWSPWYDPWYGGYGYGGPYMGPYGNCFCCYSPVIIGGGSGVVVGHRPSMSGSGMGTPGGNGTLTPSRSAVRDPISLSRPAVQERQREYTRPDGQQRPVWNDRPQREPSRDTWTRPAERPSRGQPATRPSRERTPDRSFDRGGGGGGRDYTPSRDSGGGGGNSGGGSGGGSRSGGGGRPR